MSALPLQEAQQRATELTEDFIDRIGRQALGLMPASMTQEQRRTVIDSTARMIRDVDVLHARVDLVEGTAPHADQVMRTRNRLKGLRAVAFTVMAALNPDQAWFWTEEWQPRSVRPMPMRQQAE